MIDLLVTGGAGFAGSSLALLFKKNYPEWKVAVLDNLKRRGSELNINRLKEQGIEFIHADIRLYEDFDSLPSCKIMIECSAEPSVLAGIGSSPDYLISTNLIGTINALKYANKHNSMFLFLSTSRIYPIATLEKLQYTEAATRLQLSNAQPIVGVSEKGISEQFPLEGSRSFYGATKLASELMIEEYMAFNGLKAVINRCGVLTGPWQMGKIDQGVIVLWLAKHYFKKELSYIGFNGTGKQVRDILHIKDLYRLLDWQINHIEKVKGQIFNVGGGNEVSVSLCELTDICRSVTGIEIPIHSIKENRQADIPIYITDNAKVSQATGWKPEISVADTMQEIYEWMKEHEKQLMPILA